MTATWKDVRRASIPLADLPALAELRGRGVIRVLVAGDVAWISWDPGSELMQEMLAPDLATGGGGALYRARRVLVPIGGAPTVL